MEDGYDFFADMGMLTIFSAPSYGGELDNAGAVLSVDSRLTCSLQVLRPYESVTKYSLTDSLFDEEDYEDIDFDSDDFFVCSIEPIAVSFDSIFFLLFHEVFGTEVYKYHSHYRNNHLREYSLLPVRMDCTPYCTVTHLRAFSRGREALSLFARL